MAATVTHRHRTPTSWSEATASHFHPGDVIGAITFCDEFSPNKTRGIAELVYYVLLNRRYYWEQFSDPVENTVLGIDEVKAHAEQCAPYLRQTFRQLAAFADQHNTDASRKLASNEPNGLIGKVEHIFGTTIDVFPMPKSIPRLEAQPPPTKAWTFWGLFDRVSRLERYTRPRELQPIERPLVGAKIGSNEAGSTRPPRKSRE